MSQRAAAPQDDVETEECEHHTVREKVGRYELISRIAAGGMAEVFRAVLRGPDGFTKEYAIKQMLPQLSEDPQLVGMFLDEARLASKLNHPNICQIFELGFDGGRHYIAMEYLEGRVLSDLWKRAQETGTPIDPLVAAWVVARAAEGLAWAHERLDEQGKPLHIVHRDVSPDNLMLTRDGQVKVLDFGIARATARTTKTATGMVRGKVAFMSPEQIRGEPLDARADVFSLGVVLWGLLANKPVFVRQNDAQTMYAILSNDMPQRGTDPRVPAELWTIARSALVRDPAKRLGSARELAAALDAVVQKASVAQGGESAPAFDGPSRTARLVAETPEVKNETSTAAGGAPAATPWRETFTGSAKAEAGTPVQAQKAPLSPNGVSVVLPRPATLLAPRPGTSAMPAETGRSASRWPLVLGSVVGLLVAGVCVVALWPSSTPVTPPPEVVAAAPDPEPATEPEPPPPAAPTIDVEPTVVEPAPTHPTAVPKAKRRRVAPSVTAPVEPVVKHPVVKGTGRLTLDTQPWTQIYLGTRLLGETPLQEVQVPAGHLVLRAVNAELHVEHTIEVDVPADQVVRLRKVW